MARCTFKFSITQHVDTLLGNARQSIESSGGRFNGDSGSGSFSGSTPIGSIEASYSIVGQELLISIDKKPFLLTCRRIEQELAKNFVQNL